MTDGKTDAKTGGRGESRGVPFRERFFEDYQEGEVMRFGEHLVTEAEIVEFACRYDPQPFHTDPEAARRSPFGGLIASGWMTAGIAMRMAVDHWISPLSSMGSPGIDELRWLVPVRPGDRLHARATVVQTRRSQSKPDRGLIRVATELLNQRDEVVMRYVGWGIYRTRAGAAT